MVLVLKERSKEDERLKNEEQVKGRGKDVKMDKKEKDHLKKGV